MFQLEVIPNYHSKRFMIEDQEGNVWVENDIDSLLNVMLEEGVIGMAARSEATTSILLYTDNPQIKFLEGLTAYKTSTALRAT